MNGSVAVGLRQAAELRVPRRFYGRAIGQAEGGDYESSGLRRSVHRRRSEKR
jgi:hypothetical protein